MVNEYWYNNIDLLFEKSKLLEFWPNKVQTKEEQFNSISRFIIYSGLTLSIYNTQSYYFIVSLFILILIVSFSKRLKNKYIKKNNNVVKSTNPNLTKKMLQECQDPTSNNPFSNVLMSDYTENPDRAPACSSELKSKEIKDKFNDGLFRDINDIYERENSQRQFYTTANTMIPNDQVNFAKWLYKKDNTCKSDPSTCTGFEVSGGPAGGASQN